MITTLLLIVIYLSFISLGLPDALLGSAWPNMYLSLNVESSMAGIISLIVSSGTIISSLMTDRVVKRFGTNMVTIVSVGLTAVALLGTSFAPSFVFICLASIPMGLGAGSVDAALNNYVALHYKARHMNWLHCFWGVGASASPLVMSFALREMNSWRMGYRMVGFLQVALVVILFVTRHFWDKVASTKLESAVDAEEQVIMTVRARLRLPGAKSAVLSFFSYCAMESMAGLWGASFLVFVRGVDEVSAAQWVALYYMGIMLGRFLSGFLTFRLKNRSMILIGLLCIGTGVVFLLLPLASVFLQLGFFFMGFGSAPVFPGLLQETPSNFGVARSQSMMGLQMASAYVGITLMPPLFGFLSRFLGYGFYPFYLALLFVPLVLGVWTLLSHPAKTSVER